MKTLKSKIVAGMTAFALLFGLFFTVTAFEKNQKTAVAKKTATTTWHFTGDDPSEILNPEKWEDGSSPDNCETELTLELPCTFETNVSIVDAEALIDYFESEYPIDTEEQVVENAESTRNPE
ncbi:hypothetical protein [Sphingobacterium hungaricum]|uniref:Uncharacterized protein n=1 Tax=Sphingobacterium hungaricum TaxID=2082723 RepID=A0A928YR08_9SPHI|nr:hypothetical protein [Sphingobacterium hungaricum]MBE8714821.1 hypothetical protein [Sphingobacterium hungaricum]